MRLRRILPLLVISAATSAMLIVPSSAAAQELCTKNTKSVEGGSVILTSCINRSGGRAYGHSYVNVTGSVRFYSGQTTIKSRLINVNTVWPRYDWASVRRTFAHAGFTRVTYGTPNVSVAARYRYSSQGTVTFDVIDDGKDNLTLGTGYSPMI